MGMRRHDVATGCSYSISKKRGGVTTTTHVKVLDYNPVDNQHTILCNGKVQRMDLSRYSRVERKRTPPKKTSTESVYLYLCDIGNGSYKIGASACPERRRKQIRTFCSKASMVATVRIPRNKSASFRSFEKDVLQRFAHARTAGGTEVLRLGRCEADTCASYMRSICAR